MSVEARTHSSHWGTFDALVEDGALVGIRPFAGDPHPSPLLGNFVPAIHGPARVAQPMVRAGWLERGPGPDDRRGSEPFVPLAWDEAIALLAAEYRRVYGEYGPEAVFGGSYGWASAGRFHHGQSQLHRFLNCLGGYVRSVDNYSFAAGDVILRRVAASAYTFAQRATTWEAIAEHTDLLVSFGGIPLKNLNVSPGGASTHRAKDFLRRATARGMRMVSVSPIRDDAAAWLDATWLDIVPGTDVALMLGLAYVLITEERHDRAFLDRYCVGFDRLADYLIGWEDGQPKNPEWAAAICGIAPERIVDLARQMAAGRTLVNVNWSLQRTQHGEQAPWMGLALAALLGQVGLAGGGFGFGYGSMAQVGEAPVRGRLPVFRQGRNPVRAFIPVARISEMLLNPGAPFTYDGQDLIYPDIKMVVWAGGNPFHHHQDLGRLRRAFAQPETIVVHEPFWTGAARHADVVIPSTVTLERDDVGAASNDHYLIAMRQAVAPYGQSRDDYATLGYLAAELGVAAAFTEGRSAAEWLRHLYEGWRAERLDDGLPDFDSFWARGRIELPREEGLVLFADFRADPDAAPLATPSGRIELYSETIASFGYDDCPGHPMWLAKAESPASPAAAPYPLLLVANNPRTRLHSQLDGGGYSQAAKVAGREPVRIHPEDAAARGIAAGDVVRLCNGRGSCLAGAVIDDALRKGVVQLSTGAWSDPLDPADPASMCVHGNPNVLTADRGTSKLAQGCTGQHALVQLERWEGAIPPVTAFAPPRTVSRAAAGQMRRNA